MQKKETDGDRGTATDKAKRREGERNEVRGKKNSID